MRALAAVLVLAATAHASTTVSFDEKSKKRLAAHRASRPPVIDGKLDDPVWQEAAPDDTLRQRYPHDGAAPTQRTVVRVLYDDDAVYVGVRMEDSQPDAIVARLARRDRATEADSIGVAIDSRHDHATAYAFFLNAAGVQSDLLRYNDTESSTDWDAVWQGATSRDDHGWSAEFRIPLSALRFSDAPTQEWGFQVERYISRNKEQDRWSYAPQEVRAEVSPLGHLVGLEGLHPRHTLELRPFAVARVRARTESGGAFLGLAPGALVEGEATLGLDAKVGLTSDLTLDATVNPDFGQVDADQVVLNLSHFETFFPEKRPFFLEGTDLFATPVQVFYSRRIGRGSVVPDDLDAPDGSTWTTRSRPAAVPIRAALKLAGKIGDKLAVGALEAVTGPEDAELLDRFGGVHDLRFTPSMSWAAVRARYAFQGASYLGVLATAVTRLDGDLRSAVADHDGYTQSLDGAWRSADTRWRLAAQLLASERLGGPSLQDTDGNACPAAIPGRCLPIARNDGQQLAPGDVGWGADAEVNYAATHWSFGATGRVLSPRLNLNDMGFQPRYDRRVLDGGFAYQELQPGGPLQEWNLGAGATVVSSFDDVLEDASLGARANLTLSSFWSFHADVWGLLPGTWDAFETGDGARYEQRPFAGGGVSVTSDGRRAVQLSLSARADTAFGPGGWDAGLDGVLKLVPLPTLELEIDPSIGYGGGHQRAWFPAPCLDDAGGVCGIDTARRHYRFGELDAGSLSVTARLAYTFSPTLALTGYAQLFLSRGQWLRYGTVDTVGVHPFIRYADLRPDPGFGGDSDGDGVKDDDFQTATVNLNLVLRWEYLSGATLLVVYTRAQSSDLVLAGATPRLSLRGLDTGPTEDVFLIKLSYFLG